MDREEGIRGIWRDTSDGRKMREAVSEQASLRRPETEARSAAQVTGELLERIA